MKDIDGLSSDEFLATMISNVLKRGESALNASGAPTDEPIHAIQAAAVVAILLDRLRNKEQPSPT